MAKLYFSYAAMNAGKSTALLQVAHNYVERGLKVHLLTAQLDHRAGQGVIASRMGISKESDTYAAEDNLFLKIKDAHKTSSIACVLIDEAQWLTTEHVRQLACVVDDLGIPVMCYGLRTDFQAKLFPGSHELLAIADELREIRTICHCGKKATMVVRLDEQGNAITDGPQNYVGGNESYVSVCRKHWKEALEE